ncbi:MAG TPA: IS1 family transposase [Pirellulales bacterium]|nr:IS1 family transposase [Pirellulales bacterium]
MIAFNCQHENRTKHGKDRKGQQRWKCCDCGATFISDEQRPLGDMRIDLAEAVKVLKMLLEGMSIRACERICGMKRDTICDLILLVGENCARWLETAIVGVEAKTIELDEIWDFIGMKSRTKERLGRLGDDCGDSWTWLAIDADSKLVLSHAVGLRDDATCERFLCQLNSATTGNCQVTSDGLRLYTNRVPLQLGSRVSFAQLVKTYGHEQQENRYSPAAIIGTEKTVRFGNPDEDKISTSFSERLNLSVRMHVRRFTRLTNAHSKTYQHHAAMVALFVAWYNFVRPNTALGKNVTPAMAAGITKNVWDLETLLRAAA